MVDGLELPCAGWRAVLLGAAHNLHNVWVPCQTRPNTLHSVGSLSNENQHPAQCGFLVKQDPTPCTMWASRQTSPNTLQSVGSLSNKTQHPAQCKLLVKQDPTPCTVWVPCQTRPNTLHSVGSLSNKTQGIYLTRLTLSGWLACAGHPRCSVHSVPACAPAHAHGGVLGELQEQQSACAANRARPHQPHAARAALSRNGSHKVLWVLLGEGRRGVPLVRGAHASCRAPCADDAARD